MKLNLNKNLPFVNTSQYDIENNFNKLTSANKKILNVFIGLNLDCLSKNLPMYYSRAQIGAYAGGYCEKTVSRAIKEFARLGFMHTESRLTSSNIYTVNPIIYKHARDFRHLFKSLWNKAKVFAVLVNLAIYTEPTVNADLERNVSPYKRFGYIIPCKTQGIKKEFKREQEVANKLSTTRRRFRFRPKLDAGIMEELLTAPLNATIKEIAAHLNLSQHGIFKLQVFPEYVLRQKWNYLKQNLSVKDPFAWLIYHCIQECTKKSLPVNWTHFYALMAHNNISLEDPVYAPKKQSYQTTAKFVLPPRAVKVLPTTLPDKIPHYMKDILKKVLPNYTP